MHVAHGSGRRRRAGKNAREGVTVVLSATTSFTARSVVRPEERSVRETLL